MAALARRLRINVGLAMRDGDEMVYLESVRFNARGRERSVVSGHRVPVELTALGRAWLAVAPDEERAALMARWRTTKRGRWRHLEAEIADAAESVRAKGYCVASWQPQVVVLATPLVFARRPVHSLNVSVTTERSVAAVVRQLERPLMTLAAQLREAIAEIDHGGGTGQA
jgi:DNA-binding IclR family transcriptional regulator